MDASVLILRVNALYNCARRLRHALFTMLGALLVFGVVFFTVLAVHGPTPAGRTSRCWTITFPRWAWTFWLAKVVLEGTLLALALARTLGAWARPALHATVHCPSTQHTSAQQPSALVRLLMRDSLFACTGTLSLALVNIVLWCGTNKALFYAFPGMSLAVEGVIASRLLLNLHAYTSNPDSSLGMHEGELLCIHSPEDLERVELAAPGTLDSDSAGSR
ncbi:hypothetical protein PsYK624_049260 [Phanerochaete sordida]|uniref:Uncharacterized protein n=1 Tax=Phanerochaete sordida TaxID=48140 RepID=A0A9P3LBS2_9APHY|nr:hypothetical protein PsYK624_049260 [Phanerochaete sordida]